MSTSPESSLPRALGNWADTKAAYRFFDNSKVSHAAILEEHRRRSFERMENHKVVLAIQDTTALTYGSHSALRPELGFINRSQADHLKGMLLHTTLAVSSEGLPLGVLDQRHWIRTSIRQKARQEVPVSQKESWRWIEALRRSDSHSCDIPQIVLIADREADFYELFQEVEDRKLSYVIRLARNRRRTEGEFLYDRVKREKIQGWHSFVCSSDRRKVTVSLRWLSLDLTPAVRTQSNEDSLLRPLRVSALLAREEECENGEPLEWFLLTNRAVSSPEEAIEKIGWYRQRWHIESFHKTLKSGMQVEKARFERFDRLIRFLSLCSVMSWRLYWMAHCARHDPDRTCRDLVDEKEWRAIFQTVHESKSMELPSTTPTIRDVVRWIARLGGFLARKSDGEPGMITIWKGWLRVPDLTRSYQRSHVETYG